MMVYFIEEGHNRASDSCNYTGYKWKDLVRIVKEHGRGYGEIRIGSMSQPLETFYAYGSKWTTNPRNCKRN